ncbi:hypothetical protein PILCRDRAFT_72817, partial [Piloderma croceum F 1598]
AIILPPLGVFLERGCGADLLINILLTILGWIPGIIHGMNRSFSSCAIACTCLCVVYSSLHHPEVLMKGTGYHDMTKDIYPICHA